MGVHDVAPADLTAPNQEACMAQKSVKELVPTDADDAKETAAGAEPAPAKELAPIADPASKDAVAEVSSKQDTPAKVADPDTVEKLSKAKMAASAEQAKVAAPVEKPSKAKMAAPAKSAQAKPARKGLLVRCCPFLSRKRSSKQSATSQQAQNPAVEVKPGEAIYASGSDERQLLSEKASDEIQEVVEPTIAIAAEASQMATETTKTGEEAMSAKDNEASPAKQEQVMEPATAAKLVQVVSEGNRPAEEAVHATNHEAALAKEAATANVPTVAEPAQVLTPTNGEEADEAVHVGMFSHCCSAKPLSSTEIVVKNMA